MSSLLSLWPLALQRLRHRWRLMLPLLVGAVLAVALLSSVLVYGDAVRLLGLTYTLRQQPASALDIQASAYNASANTTAYASIRSQVDGAAARNIGWFAKASVRGMESATFFVNSVARGNAQPDTSAATLAARTAAQAKDDPRLRATFVFVDGLAAKTTVLSGGPIADASVTMGPGNKPIGNPALPVWVTAGTAASHGLRVSDSVVVTPYWESGTPYAIGTIAGIVQPKDPSDPYWTSGLYRDVATTMGENYIPMFVTEKTFQTGVAHLFPEILVNYDWTFQTNAARIAPGDAALAAYGVQRMNTQLQSGLNIGYFQQTSLDQLLQEFTTRDEFGRVPLLIITMMIVAVVLYYLVIVAGVVVRRQLDEMALLRSRGADPPQLLALYIWESAALSTVAFLLGPLVALAATAALGYTPAFSALTGGGALAGRVTPDVVVLATGGTLIALAAMVLPAVKGATLEMHSLRARAARPTPASFVTRYYLDLSAAVFAGFLFWEMTQRGSVVSESFSNGSGLDYLLLAAPAFMLTAIALVFLRVFPLVASAMAWLAGRFANLPMDFPLREMARNPLPYALPILLLMFASAIAMFAANFGATLNRSYRDRAAYESGSPVRVLGGVAPSGLFQVAGNHPSELAISIPSSLAYRSQASIATELFNYTSYDLLAVDPATFTNVAYFRKDFSSKPLPALMQTLSSDTPSSPVGIPIPPGATSIGVWALPSNPNTQYNVQLAARLADAHGHYADLTLGNLGVTDWTLLSTPLNAPGRGSPPLQPPLRLIALHVLQTSGATAVPGAVYLNEIEALGPGSAAPVTLVDLRQPGPIEVIHDDQSSAADSLETTSTVARSGQTSSAVFAWGSGFLGTGRGLVLSGVDLTSPMQAIISRTMAEKENVKVGDRLVLATARHEVPVRVAEIVDFFPTLDPYANGFAVLDMPSLFERLNAVTTDSGQGPNEAWLAPATPPEQAAAAQFRGSSVTDQQTLLASYQADPLTAAGWNGALIVAFFAVLVATLLGFSVYSLVQSQARRGQFALLRSLGMSFDTLTTVVLVEQLVVIVTGMALGGFLGARMTTLMMPFLGLNETGARVIPPFALQIDWPTIAVVYGIMAVAFLVTTAVLIAVLSRTAISSALRFGEA